MAPHATYSQTKYKKDNGRYTNQILLNDKDQQVGDMFRTRGKVCYLQLSCLLLDIDNTINLV